MANRCGVINIGTHLDRAMYDDGALTLPFLHGRFAERLFDSEDIPDEDIFATGQDYGSEETAQAVSQELLPNVLSEPSEGDLLGHMQIDMNGWGMRIPRSKKACLTARLQGVKMKQLPPTVGRKNRHCVALFIPPTLSVGSRMKRGALHSEGLLFHEVKNV
eukprot:TRINITY_DN50916_c0_g1_i1.p1 TRINITY_DN50916_c0_g1~~TRINITY_DN50916_c0_g1_i1.p1  ORF type:complete len:174 (+),score=15.31 TRINITY_DN50916_c0_g1_i1:40-522(+)